MAAVNPWNYTGLNAYGPDRWSVIAPAAAGAYQSPVVILPEKAEYDRQLRENPLSARYEASSIRTIHNIGFGLQLNTPSHLTTGRLTGGPLNDDVYVLSQFHFHWGDHSCHGSEHIVRGETYAAEVHFVHWNSTRYSSMQEAVTKPDGLCVLCVFVESGDDNSAIEELCQLLPAVNSVGLTADLPDTGFPPDSLFPGDIKSYWTYHGSLTTPPCHESVTFIVFKAPISASERQLNEFRSLRGSINKDGPLVNNFRPIQSLNGRVIKSSFRKFFT